MQTLSRAIRNLTAQVGSQAVTWIATLSFTAALGRHLGDTGLGILYLGISFTSLFGVLVNFGLDPLVSREVARDPDAEPKYLLHGLLTKGLLWVVAFFGIYLSSAFLDYPWETRKVLMIYAIALALTSFSSLLAAAYRGRERLVMPSTATIVDKTLVAVVGVAILRGDGGVVEIAWVMVLGAAAHLACLLSGLVTRMSFTWKIDFGFLRTLLVAGAPFVAYYLVLTINWRIDAVMLSKMTDTAVLGWYAASYRLFETLLFLQNVVAASIMMPILSRLSTDSRGAMQIAFEKGLGLLLLAGIPMCAGLIVLASPIIEFIYARPDLNPAIPVLQVLAVSLVVLYVNSAICWALVSLDKERALFPLFTAAAVGNILLNLVLIPTFQHTGAAFATLASEVVIGMIAATMLPKWLVSARPFVLAGKAALSAAGMALALMAVQDRLPILLLIPAGGLVYAVLLVMLKAVPYEDIAMLRRAIMPVRRKASVGESHAV